VDTVLGEVLERHGLQDQVRRMEAVESWPEIVGEHVAKATRVRGVDGDALVVEVRSSAWLMELNMMRAEFLQRVNRHLPEAPLRRIVFVLAETG
jgi:predicted nucleic acid-binding Zn ribbon protein